MSPHLYLRPDFTFAAASASCMRFDDVATAATSHLTFVSPWIHRRFPATKPARDQGGAATIPARPPNATAPVGKALATLCDPGLPSSLGSWGVPVVRSTIVPPCSSAAHAPSGWISLSEPECPTDYVLKGINCLHITTKSRHCHYCIHEERNN